MAQIILNETEFCKLDVHYEADPQSLTTKKSEVINKFKDYPMSGFRQGKATIDAIKVRYRKEIEEAVKQELAEDAFQNTLLEKNIKPFGRPTINSINLTDNRFYCNFTLYKQPDFVLAEYKGFDVPKAPQAITQEEFAQRILQDLRTRYGNTIPYQEDDFVQMGDSIIVNYNGSIDGQMVDSLSADGEIMTVGKTAIPEFDQNLLGIKVGEVREFVVNVPETSIIPTVAGKSVKFVASLLMGSKIEPAPLDDELAKKMGLETIQSLMDNISSTASVRLNEIDNGYMMDQIARRLIANHTFQIPQWISTAEAKMNVANNKQSWDDMTDEQKQLCITQAENGIKLSLVLDKIRESEPEAQMTDEEVFKSVRENVVKVSPNPEEVLTELLKNGHIAILMGRVKDEYVLDFIKKTCNIIQ